MEIGDRVKIIATAWYGREGIIIKIDTFLNREPWLCLDLDGQDIVFVSAFEVEKILGGK